MVQKINKTIGGKAIASGGYGCVFSPALQCDGSSKRQLGKISKLMTEKHAKKEYEEIMKFKEILKDIPNYSDYFLLNDITICKPSKIPSNDLTDFNKKCKALPKDKITKQNINDNLSKLLTINMPNGGKPVDDFIYDNGSFEKLYRVNESLINLFKNGIIPMNKKNIYHCDIKDSNILVDDSQKKLETRLIDWGLSTEYKPFKNEPFPKTWRNRPLQYNVPFSVILFSDAFVYKYTEYIKNGGKINKTSLKPFIINYLHFWIQERGTGHYKIINEIMYILYSNELTTLNDDDKKQIIENEFTLVYITDYIVNILIHYTKFRKDGSLNLREYLDNVFIENVDVWGFCISYFPYLEIFYNNYNKLVPNEIEIFNSVKQLFIRLYSTSNEKLNKENIIINLQNLNNLIKINIKDNLDNNLENSEASGIKLKNKKIKNKNFKISNRKKLVKNISKVSFKKVPKSKTRKFKKLLLISAKLKK
jgi:hypothetical protein